MKFEYKTFHLELDASQVRRTDQTLEALQELGKDGWEVVTKLYEQKLVSILLLKRSV